MVALKGNQVDAFLANPDPARPVVLLFGPDAGLVRERVDVLLRMSVDDVRDPFALTRLEGDELSADPMRLVDEATTVPLFGGRRAVWVRAGARNFAPAVEALLKIELRDCRVVIEAGDLRRNAPLRMLCEQAPNAVAIVCYADDERAIGRLIDQEMRAAGLRIAADARAALVSLLGADRRASLSELRKLALYAQGRDRVELEDVMAVVADASTLALDALIDAALVGRHAQVEILFRKARQAGTAPSALLSIALRHVTQLHKASLAVAEGAPVASVVERMIPPVHFSRRPLVESVLKAWTPARLERAMLNLAEAIPLSRRRPELAEPIAHRALMAITAAARRSG